MNEQAIQAEFEGTNQEGIRRGSYVLIVALFPVLLPAVISCLVYVVSTYQNYGVIGAKTEYANINYPQSGKRVPEKFTANGTVEERSDDLHVFISSKSDGLYWPKTQVHSNSWEVPITAPGSPGHKFDLVVMAVGDKDRIRIDNWFQVGRETGQYPGLGGFEDLQTLASVKVVK